MSSAPSPTTVPEAQARELLLVRAFEESDSTAALLSPLERERALPRAVSGAGLEALATRARTLLAILRTRARGTEALLSGAGADATAAWLAPLAFALGLLSNVLGTASVVNVLAFPLLGALVWNLAVYAALVVLALRGGRDAPQSPGLARHLAERALASRVTRALRGNARESTGVVAQAGATFVALWLDAARPLLAARLRRALHLGAAALVAGLVAGMYLRGVAFEYRASWGSTFLSPEAVDVLLGLVLAPARWLAGIEPPPASAIRAPQSGPAAPWIHLWALTAALLVVAPRLGLWLVEGGRARRAAGAIPIDLGQPYWRRLLSSSAGRGVRVSVTPYSVALAPRSLDRLRALLHDLLGARAEVAQGAALEYGAEAADLDLSSEAVCVVLVFALAQPPELEVHARLLSELVERLPSGGRLLALVDAAGFSARLGGGEIARERLDERRRAWDRIAREAGLQLLHVDLSAAPDERELERAGAALWTAGAAERA